MKSPIPPRPEQVDAPPSSAPAPWYQKRWFIGLAAVVVAAIIIAAIVALTTGGRERAAVAACHEDTLDRAKYPGAAEIVTTHIEKDDEVDNQFHVSGTADFPNGWGTPVRQTYLCAANVEMFGETTIDDNILMEGDWLGDL